MRTLDVSASPFTGDPGFTGAVSGVHLARLADPTLHAYVVSFDPGARTAWHAHEHRQLLICTAGAGQVGNRRGDIRQLRPGVAVRTEPGEEHWHGATCIQPMTHVAVQTAAPGSDGSTWAEPVTASDQRGPR